MRRKLRGEPLAEERLVALGGANTLQTMESPESIVDSVDLHARRASPAVLCGDKTLCCNQRHRLPERARQLFAEKSLRYNHAIRIAEPLQDEIAQARAHRYAHHQRAREDSDRDRNACDDGEIRAPVVAQASALQGPGVHRATPHAAASDRPNRTEWENARRDRRC